MSDPRAPPDATEEKLRGAYKGEGTREEVVWKEGGGQNSEKETRVNVSAGFDREQEHGFSVKKVGTSIRERDLLEEEDDVRSSALILLVGSITMKEEKTKA